MDVSISMVNCPPLLNSKRCFKARLFTKLLKLAGLIIIIRFFGFDKDV
ncbi:hypothetical protein HMPREF9554_01605 [Treponema phagedenis F0421]|nr:hypothetical protein HMPREF9554_01605 [Treponema phagedenis F0421]